MECPNCKLPNDDGQTRCPLCGEPLPKSATASRKAARSPEPSHVMAWLGPAVLTTVFCFPPLGLVAIIYGILAQTRLDADDTEGARWYASRARVFVILAGALGIALILFFIIRYW